MQGERLYSYAHYPFLDDNGSELSLRAVSVQSATRICMRTRQGRPELTPLRRSPALQPLHSQTRPRSLLARFSEALCRSQYHTVTWGNKGTRGGAPVTHSLAEPPHPWRNLLADSKLNIPWRNCRRTPGRNPFGGTPVGPPSGPLGGPPGGLPPLAELLPAPLSEPLADPVAEPLVAPWRAPMAGPLADPWRTPWRNSCRTPWQTPLADPLEDSLVFLGEANSALRWKLS